MSDGTRTHDRLDHNQELYQLSYAHHVAGRGPRPREHSACARGPDHPARRAGNVRCMGMVRRRADGWSWDGVAPREYATGAERHTLIGAAEGARDVELRYFRIPAGGASALESHPHEHAILILHGRAEVRLGEEVAEAGPGDAVFVASQEPHRLTAAGDEPLGFLCTALVDRARAPGAPS